MEGRQPEIEGGPFLDGRQLHTGGRNTFANNFWQTYSGYGAPSGRTSGVLVPSALYQGTIKTSGFIPGFAGAGSLPPELLVYSPYDLYGFLQGLGDPWAQQIDGFNYPGDGIGTPTLANSLANCASANPAALCAYHGSLDNRLDAGGVQDITEKTWAFSSAHSSTRRSRTRHFT